MADLPILLQVHLFDAASLLHSFGPWLLAGVAVVIFIESGVLFPFLPGDSLLVTAGILAPQLGFPAWQIAAVAVIAAFAGDQVGFWLGRRFGRRLFKPGAGVLKPEYLARAEDFFTRYGGFSLVMGRFVPVVRTYVPLAAGMADMPYRRFLLWNPVGGAAWAVSMVLVGILFASIPLVTGHIDVVMIGVVILSLLPIALTALRRRRTPASS